MQMEKGLQKKTNFKAVIRSQDPAAFRQVTGKDYFNKGFASDHLTMIQACFAT